MGVNPRIIMASDAVGLDRISRVIGYKITKGTFVLVSTNLPQRIAILAEANHANQGSLDLEPFEFTTAQEVGERYGFGSPAYNMARILRPKNGDGVGAIPTVIYPQAAAVGATARVVTVTPVGTATKNGTHTLYIAGRTGVDGSYYEINIVTGDTVADITQKIEDAVNGVLGSPMTAVSTDYLATLTTKWKGLTAQDVAVEVGTGDVDLGVSYVVTESTAGSATPSISAALDLFGSIWNTIVVCPYGTTTVMNALEAFNGIADPTSPTGRYAGTIMKPFIALIGSTEDDPSDITDDRDIEMTIAICPAPGSDGLPMEAAANAAFLFANIEQNSPHLDIAGRSYPDMPVPVDGVIGTMASFNERDIIVKKGCSTVDLVAGKYQVQDFVTTYHPDGEIPPQFRYCRNIMLDLNVRYSYYLLEQINVVDHVIISDNDVVEATNIIQPKRWKAILAQLADSLVSRALISDASFMIASITVEAGESNPDRLETFFKYKRTGIARISSTTAEAGFNLGS